MTSEGRAFDADEYQALRREIELRIVLQNLGLMLLVVLFTGVVTIQALRPAVRYQLALGYGVSAGMLSLFWIHSGARTLQIKTYLRHVLEPRLGGRDGWETWHAVNRVQGVLGSRWFISTKGVLVGSQLAVLTYAWFAGPPMERDALYAGLAALGAAMTAFLLRRPSLAPEAHRTAPQERDSRSTRNPAETRPFANPHPRET